MKEAVGRVLNWSSAHTKSGLLVLFLKKTHSQAGSVNVHSDLAWLAYTPVGILVAEYILTVSSYTRQGANRNLFLWQLTNENWNVCPVLDWSNSSVHSWRPNNRFWSADLYYILLTISIKSKKFSFTKHCSTTHRVYFRNENDKFVKRFSSSCYKNTLNKDMRHVWSPV